MGFREKIIVFAVIPWVLALLMLFFITLPVAGFIFGKFNDTAVKYTEINKLESSIKEQKDISVLKNAIDDYETELKGFNKQFPENDDFEPLYVDLQSALNKTDLTLQKLALSKDKLYRMPKNFWDGVFEGEPGAAASKDKKSKISKKSKKKKAAGKKGKKVAPFLISVRTVKLDITGNYSDVIKFLYYLSNYYRFLSLKNISIKTEGKLSPTGVLNPNNLKTSLTFDLYTIKKNLIVPDEEEDKKGKKSKADKSSDNTEDNEKDKEKEKPTNE